MTLAQLRHQGVTINLKQDGGLGVVGAAPPVIEAIKQNKASIIETLKRERLDGIDYHDSKLYWSLNVLYDSWYSLPESEERLGALRLCSKWDSALTDNFALGCQMVIEEQPMLELLAESAPLEGVTLHRTLSAMVGEMPQKQTQTQTKTVDRSALDEPTRKPTSDTPAQSDLFGATITEAPKPTLTGRAALG